MPYTHCSGTFSAAAATMKYVHRRIMELSCLGFSIWWKQVLISGRHFTHLCRALGYGSEWASLPSALSKCPCGVGNTAATSVPVSCPHREVAAWCLPPTAHLPALPRVAFVSFSSQHAVSHSESPLLGRLWFVPWPQDLQDLLWVGSRRWEWGKTPSPSPQWGLPSHGSCCLLAHSWEPSKPLVNPSKDRQQKPKGLSHLYGWSLLVPYPRGREKVSSSKCPDKFCFASLVLSQTWQEQHLLNVWA